VESRSLPIDIPMDAVAELCRKYHVRELALFGSVLDPRFGPDSDVDVLVDFEADARIGFLGLAALARELGHVLDRQVDLVPKNGLKQRIRRSILESAEVIYAG
jgi:uncharacterized protein